MNRGHRGFLWDGKKALNDRIEHLIGYTSKVGQQRANGFLTKAKGEK